MKAIITVLVVMKAIVAVLIVVILVGCKESGDSAEAKVAPVAGGDENKAPRANPLKGAYLPNGNYTANVQPWCINGDCSYYTTMPLECVSVEKFTGDFTVFNDNQATFWNSVTEDIGFTSEPNGLLDDNHVEILSDDSSHMGYMFKYQYQGNHKWIISFSEECGRRYECYAGDCLE